MSTRALVLVLALSLATGGCAREEQDAGSAPPNNSERALVVSGQLRAGNLGHEAPLTNPLAEDAAALADGRRLYTWFNCAGCHGTLGGGGIGPPLRDGEWIYGSDPASVFQTIAQGRPDGMPAFGGLVPDEQIWRIVRYVRSLGGETPVIRAGGSSGKSPTEAQQGR